MHCYICDRETTNFRKDPDGTFVCICSSCRKAINDCNKIYKDIYEDDVYVKASSMSDVELIEYIDKSIKE